VSAITGVAGEERRDFTKQERKELRARSLRLLGSLLSPLKKQLVVTALVVLVSTALQVIGPAIIAYGIDSGLPALLKGQALPLAGSVVVYLVAGVLSGVLIASYTVQTARISQAVLIDLRERVFVQTQRLSLEFHEQYTSGRIISRQTSDLDSIRELLDGGINELVMSVLYMLFTAVALVLLDGWSGLILFCSFVPLAFLIRWFQRRSEATFRESRVSSAKLIVFFVETMTGIRAVQAFRKEPRNQKEYGALAEDYRSINARAIRLFAVLEPGLTLIGNLTVAAVLLFGAFRVIDGGLEIGALLAAVLYSRRFFDPMEDIATFYNAYQSAEAALEKISGVLEESPTVPEPVSPKPLGTGVTGRVRFEGVRFAYRTDREVRARRSRSSAPPAPASRPSRS
jgi:ATP-binding cassette subfamily B protein